VKILWVNKGKDREIYDSGDAQYLTIQLGWEYASGLRFPIEALAIKGKAFQDTTGLLASFEAEEKSFLEGMREKRHDLLHVGCSDKQRHENTVAIKSKQAAPVEIV